MAVAERFISYSIILREVLLIIKKNACNNNKYVRSISMNTSVKKKMVAAVASCSTATATSS